MTSIQDRAIALQLLLLWPFLCSAGTPAGVSFDEVLALPAAEPAEVFRYGESPAQFAELWLPRSSGKAPLVVFIHGGCWLNAYSIGHSHALATGLAEAGFAVWNIEYRRVGDAGGGWPGSFEDIRAALTLLAQERPPGVDLRRLLIAGHSAGGHLALLAGSSQLTAPLTGLGLRGVVGLAAITDIATYTRGEGSCQAAAARFMGGSPGERPAAYRLANPAGLPVFSPTTLMLGTSDRIVPRAQGRLEGAQIQWLEAGHFDWIHPGTPAWLSFMRLLEALAE